MTAIERRIRVGDDLVPYDDATKVIILDRTLRDILGAIPGNAAKCMNARCIAAKRNIKLFPHPVHAVSVIKTRAYIVDQKASDGRPTHVVRYALTRLASKQIEAHDQSETVEPGKLRLAPPKDPKGSPIRASYPEGRYGGGGRFTGDGSNTGKKARPRAEKGRLAAAAGREFYNGDKES